MLTVKCLRDLEEFGIVPLTGEADALSYRCLCDLTAQGRQIVAETHGTRENGFPENWNCGSANKPHVASVMLAYGAWRDIAPIALLSCCHTVFQTEDSVFGLQENEELLRA